LFAIARANADAVRAAFETVAAGMPPNDATLLAEFASWVEAESLIAINVKLFVAVELANGRSYQNAYEWAQEQSRLSGRPAEDVLRERLHRYYDRRVAFDRAFKDGERFRYGFLNAGGAGLPEYDPYCMVLTRTFQSSLSEAACLPGDSLTICFAATGAFRQNAVELLAVSHSHRHFMVAKERATEVIAVGKQAWPALVASPGRYFEVVFIGEFSRDAVACIRVSKAEHDRMWDLAFASFGRRLGDAERALVNDFVQLRRAVLDGNVHVEVVA
jgi:hypothetical protein